METSTLLYLIGLILVIFFILSGIDDVIWDLFTLFTSKKDKHIKDLELSKLDAIPPKMIAVMLAAWDEESVLESVIDNVISSQMYPQTMYHIFLGVYPNDEPTVRIAQKLAQKYPNVHCIINFKEGPTSKAQNLNYVLQQIKEYEKKHHYQFAAFTIHDSEDVVHPYELKVTNYLIDQHPALQFPVFPLIHKPTFKNYFKDLTTNTYVDEFAENHYLTMRNRHQTGAFVPSAGTGFSLSREVVELLGSTVLPENSLTEDYRLSLTLYEKGIQMYYVLERMKRVTWEGKISWDYIATRSIFPNTFKAAVKQKTRWTLGITMQSYQFRNLFKGDLPLIGRYSLYRDQKAKISNLLAGIGYPVLIYFIVSLFTPLTPIYPYYSLSWYLSLIVTFMMVERQLLRGYALYQVYGFRSTFFGVLFPPLIPFRIIWGNAINFTSTVRAYWQYMKKTREEKENAATTDLTIQEEKELLNKEKQSLQLAHPTKKFTWAKTEHDFPDREVLNRYHRKLGDILLEKGYLDILTLNKALKNKSQNERLGEFLVSQEKITCEQLMESLAVVEQKSYLTAETLTYYPLAKVNQQYKEVDWQKLKALPLYETENELIVACSNLSSLNIEEQLTTQLNKEIEIVLATPETIEAGYQCVAEEVEPFEEYQPLEQMLPVEQVILVRNLAAKKSKSETTIMQKMGLMLQEIN